MEGTTSPWPEALPRAQCSTDPAAPADAVILLEGAATDGLMARLAKHDKALLPIGNFSGAQFKRADYAGPALSEVGLTEFTAKAIDILGRLSELPPPAAPSDRPALEAMAMAFSRESELLADWCPLVPEAVRYPLLEGIPVSRESLEDLAAGDLLRRRPFDTLHLCGHCGSSRLNVREECIKCGSSNLRQTSLVHHYRCAHQAPAEEFERPDGGLLCPKCGDTLRHYGVDYDRPAEIFHCGDCGHVNDEPAVGFVCMDCGKRTEAERADKRTWHHYALTSKGVAALKAGALPARSLGAAIARIMGTYSPRDFRLLCDYQSDIARRYERPLCGGVLEVANYDELAQRLGGRRLNQLFTLLAEIISQTLRTSDAVALSGRLVLVLFAETPRAGVERALERMRQRADETLSEPVDLRIDIFEADDWERFMEQVP
ncbi:MAG: hypothetical protein D6807_03835 [Alphaproteobacteria bacterium]|nr:MAG: hypothetical protein D6807_03835 [Alphaproteobacteria bacterium]